MDNRALKRYVDRGSRAICDSNSLKLTSRGLEFLTKRLTAASDSLEVSVS